MIVFFLSSLAAWLTAAGPHTVSRAELTARLKYYRTIGKLETKFHETKRLKNIGTTIESEGELTIVRPSKVIWKVTRPGRLTVELTDGKMRITDPSGKTETYEADASARDSLRSMVAWLKLDPDELLASYRITDLGAETYRFEPKDREAAPVAAMQMKVKPGSYLERLDITEKSGDALEIRFDRPRIERRDE